MGSRQFDSAAPRLLIIGWIRRVAQAVRHAPYLSGRRAVWTVIRPIYRRFLAAAGSSGIPVMIGGQSFRIHADYAQSSYETFEPASYALLPRYLRPGDVFVDVGAAIGSYSLVAGRLVGSQGKVVCYEADPAARRYLDQHLIWNSQADRTIVRPVCCGRAQDDVEFFTSPTDIGGEASLFPKVGFKPLRVKCVTLDADLSSMEIVPNFIKIDVEGAEWDVLFGVERMLQQHHPRLLISLHLPQLEEQGVSERMVLEWLSAHDYSPTVVERDYEVHVFAT